MKPKPYLDSLTYPINRCSDINWEVGEIRFGNSAYVERINWDILEERFLVTYGDGLANVNINKLIDFHKKNNSIGTMTVTNPVSRFGLVNFNKESRVESFIEKPKLDGFVNIGFMIFEKNFLKYLNYESTLESKPLAELSKDGELYAFKHFGFFEPMDTYREYLNMNKLYNSGNMPWKNFN